MYREMFTDTETSPDPTPALVASVDD